MHTAQTLLYRFKNLRTLPHVAIRLSKLISDENVGMRQFEEVIRMDPTLVLRLLRLVNSPFYGLLYKVDSISKAVVFIGMKNLRNMVVVEALKDIFKKEGEGAVFSRSGLWLHSAGVSMFSQMISERIFGVKGEDAFLCGILHDIGMIVEHQVVPDLFVKACETYDPEAGPITEYEKKIIGTDHCNIGCFLARDWKIPQEIQEGIIGHHKSLKSISPSSLTGIIQAADYFVAKMGYVAIAGFKGSLSPDVAAHIRENLEEYKALVRDFPEEMNKAKQLYDTAG